MPIMVSDYRLPQRAQARFVDLARERPRRTGTDMFSLLAHNRRRERGFEIPELLVVLVVLAVLAAIVLPKFTDSTEQSRVADLKRDLKLLRAAVDMFQTDTGCFPLRMADLSARKAPAVGLDSTGKRTRIAASEWHGPYLQKRPEYPLAGGEWGYSTSPPDVGRVRPDSPYENW